jgi:hypothetical protein
LTCTHNSFTMYFKGILQHNDLYITQPIKHVELKGTLSASYKDIYHRKNGQARLTVLLYFANFHVVENYVIE